MRRIASPTSADASSTLANIGATFRFTGSASHAAAAPDKGRSALDGLEAQPASALKAARRAKFLAFAQAA